MNADKPQTPKRSLSIALTGAGGAGVITAGNMLLEAAAKAGWYGLFMRSSGPQIRGGEAAALLHLSHDPVSCPHDAFDILVAVDWFNIERFSVEMPLNADSLVFGDPAQGDIPEVIAGSGAACHELPMKDMAKAVPKGRANMIALGVVVELLGLGEEIVDAVLVKTLKKKGGEALQASRAAVRAGVEYAAALSDRGADIARPEASDGRMLISGNQATGLGALRGGIRFAAAYPITPATEILEWMSPNIARLGGVLVQAEDELAAVNMIVGSSFGGTPSFTATSGPGLALMLETIGLGVAAEIPIVVVDVMRGGPSTGIPTKSEQSDLNIALFGMHGDAPHLVIAPSSIADCVFTTHWAAHLAETLQVPTVVLSDQSLGQSRAITDKPADLAFVTRRTVAEVPGENYHRYANIGGGVSPMAIPGTVGGSYTADGLEHSERGAPSSDADDHATQLDKRLNKLRHHDYGDHWADIDGDGEFAVITWGSSAGAVREAIKRLGADGAKYRVIVPRLLAPAQPEKLAKALDGASRALVVEQTHTAQFFHYLKGYFDPPCPLETYHRPGPVPFRPAELMEHLADWSAS